MEKVIVIWWLGYIGKILSDEIKKANMQAIVIDNNFLNLANKNDKFINCDILDKKRLDSILEKHAKEASYIINLAAVVWDPACLVDTRFALQVNCVGTRNVMEVANKYNYKVIHASTCSLYWAENCSMENKLTEENHTFPIDFYWQTKYQQERFVQVFGNDNCVFRLGTAYGWSPRMRYDLVINVFSWKAANWEKITVFWGKQYRPFTHVRDISRAFIFAIQNNLKWVYNLAWENVTIVDVAQKVKKLCNTEVELSNLIEDPRNYISSSEKLLKAWFEFKWNIEKWIKEMFEKSKWMNYKLDIYNNQKISNSIKLNEANILITWWSGKLGKACKHIIWGAQYPGRKKLDLWDENSINKYFETNNIETIVHLGAMTWIPPCEENKEKAYDINVDGTRRLLKEAKKKWVKHFIYLSTACVFPWKDKWKKEDEDGIPYPKHFYGLTKLLAEEIAKTYDSKKMKVTVIRTNFTSMPWEYPKAFIDRYGTYLFAQWVARWIKDIIVYKPENTIIHVCGDKKISMYDYAILWWSKVSKMTTDDYKWVWLTKDMSLSTKYWHTYSIDDSNHNDD
jgi:nucleoside-diphosphate-sugar epimerase